MDNDLQNIDDLFRSEIESYEAMPSPEVFQSLTSLLYKQHKQQVIQKQFYYGKAVIIIFLLLISVALSDINISMQGQKATNHLTNNIKIFKVDVANSEHINAPVNLFKQKGRKNIAILNKTHSGINVYKDKKNERIANDNANKIIDVNSNAIKNPLPAVSADSNNILQEKNIHTSTVADLNKNSVFDKKENPIAFQKFKPYFIITPEASTELAKYNLENNAEQDNNNMPQNYKNEIGTREKHDLSLTAGVLINYQFKKEVGLEAGIIYSNTIISIGAHDIYAVKQSNGSLAYKYNASSGYAYLNPSFGLPLNVGDSISTSAAQHNLKYLSVPVMLKYKIGDKKIYFTPAIGLTANVLLASSIKTEIKSALNSEQASITKLYGLKRSYIGYIIKTELGYNLKDDLAVNIQSTCRYALTSINNTNVVKTYPYSFGIGIGISYKF